MQKLVTFADGTKSLWRSGIRDAADAETGRHSERRIAYRALWISATICCHNGITL
jgi:hypothetical protein